MVALHIYCLVLLGLSLLPACFTFIWGTQLPSYTAHHSHQRTTSLICGKTCLMSAVPLSERIKANLIKKYTHDDINRVLRCWDSFSRGESVERYLDEGRTVFQSAQCFIEGLTAQSFHDTSKFPWALNLESRYNEILQELIVYNKKLEKKKESNEDPEWLPPRDQSGYAYGPSWKTLGLQDRGVWDSDSSINFPNTVKYINDFNVPSCEVFFAKQGPHSGIAPHSDKNNFIITCHVAIDVPEGECWIKVGDTKYYWQNGKAVVFDTSIIHSTENSSDRTRYVLLIRFWHPELTATEIDALRFIFDCLDYAAMGDEALDAFEFKHLFQGKDKEKKVKANISPLAAEIISANRGGRSSLNDDDLEGKRSKSKTKSTNSGGPKGFGKK